MKIKAYHGSQTTHLKIEDRALYFVTNYDKAISYAKREWDEGLIEGEIPTIYTAELTINNPYTIKDYDEFQMDFTDTALNEYRKDELIEKGYDSVIYNDRGDDLIATFFPNQVNILKVEKLPPSKEYYYNGELTDEDDINDYYYDDLNESYIKQINEVLRIAGVEQLDEVSKKEYTTIKSELSGDMLYHGTTLESAYRIFTSNHIHGGTPIRINDETKYFGVSTSRSYKVSLDFVSGANDGYIQNYNQKPFFIPIVVFAFDRQVLKGKHKIIPFDFFSDEKNARIKGMNEREEVVVGNIGNIKNTTQKIILNNDAIKLLDSHEMGKFLLYRDYGVENLDTDESTVLEDAYSEGQEYCDYDSERNCYIDKNGNTLDDNDLYELGINLLIKKKFPDVDEFTQFLKNKLAHVYLGYLGEEIIYAEADAIDDNIYREPNLKYVILKNPSRKEFKENKMFLSRWCYDSKDNFYFCDAYDLTHEKMESILADKDIFTEDMMGFYNYYTNTISCRDDYGNDPEVKEKYRKITEKGLKEKVDYFNKAFGDFNYDNFEGEYPDEGI